MKHIKKIIATVVLSITLLLSMSGCSGYSFYNDWHQAGADIDRSHIFISIGIDEVARKIEANETFALLYATSESQASVAVVTSLQIQAEYLGCEDKHIYFLNAANYLSTSALRKEVKEKTKIHDPMDETSDDPIIITYDQGRVDVGTSYKSKPATKKYLVDNTVQYASLASHIFRELLVE